MISPAQPVQWISLTFEQLSNYQLYELIQLRVNVFVVEQNCPYCDLDDKDTRPGVRHLLGYAADQTLMAYARLLPPGISYSCVSIGRVITHTDYRGKGVGHQLIEEAIRQCQQIWPDQGIEISAQAHLQDYYAQHGFVRISEPYLEDNIPHVHMRRD